MTSIVPFESGNLPAYLQDAPASDINKDVFQAPQYNTMSIRGKRFTANRDGVKTVLMKPNAPDEVAQNLELVLLRANMKAKTFYAKKYVEGESENTPPTCYSMDGVAPSPMASEKQSAKCASCKHNVWGSRINDDGEAKGRACSDSARLAIAAPDALDQPYLLRVPPASLKPLREAVKKINERKVPYNVVVMKVGFDIEASSPKLTFKPVGLITEEAFRAVNTLYEGETVRAIVGADDHGEGAPAPGPTGDDDDAAFDAVVAARGQTAATPAPAPAEETPKPTRARTAKPPAPAPTPAPAPAAEAESPAPSVAPGTVQVSGEMMDDLDALLGGFDD